MASEIERKYLVKFPPLRTLHRYSSYQILQGYIVVTEALEVRLRQKGSRYYQAVKMGIGLARDEIETELNQKQFYAFWHLTDGKRIEKTRYEIKYEDRVIELDVYQGALEGLVTAEVEFEREEDAVSFNPPLWLADEITHDENYKNKNLALNGKP